MKHTVTSLLVLYFLMISVVQADPLSHEEKNALFNWQQTTFNAASTEVQVFVRELLRREIAEALHVLRTNDTVLEDPSIAKETLMEAVLKTTTMGLSHKIYREEITHELAKEVAQVLKPIAQIQDALVEKMIRFMKQLVELWFSQNADKIDLLKLYSGNLREATADYQFLAGLITAHPEIKE